MEGWGICATLSHTLASTRVYGLVILEIQPVSGLCMLWMDSVVIV